MTNTLNNKNDLKYFNKLIEKIINLKDHFGDTCDEESLLTYKLTSSNKNNNSITLMVVLGFQYNKKISLNRNFKIDFEKNPPRDYKIFFLSLNEYNQNKLNGLIEEYIITWN